MSEYAPAAREISAAHVDVIFAAHWVELRQRLSAVRPRKVGEAVIAYGRKGARRAGLPDVGSAAHGRTRYAREHEEGEGDAVLTFFGHKARKAKSSEKLTKLRRVS